jgi:hypothetical protein
MKRHIYEIVNDVYSHKWRKQPFQPNIGLVPRRYKKPLGMGFSNADEMTRDCFDPQYEKYAHWDSTKMANAIYGASEETFDKTMKEETSGGDSGGGGGGGVQVGVPPPPGVEEGGKEGKGKGKEEGEGEEGKQTSKNALGAGAPSGNQDAAAAQQASDDDKARQAERPGLLGRVGALFGRMTGRVSGAAKDVGEKTGKAISNIADDIKTDISGLGHGGRTIAGLAGVISKEAGGKIAGGASLAWGGAKDFGGELAEGAKEVGGKIAGGARSAWGKETSSMALNQYSAILNQIQPGLGEVQYTPWTAFSDDSLGSSTRSSVPHVPAPVTPEKPDSSPEGSPKIGSSAESDEFHPPPASPSDSAESDEFYTSPASPSDIVFQFSASPRGEPMDVDSLVKKKRPVSKETPLGQAASSSSSVGIDTPMEGKPSSPAIPETPATVKTLDPFTELFARGIPLGSNATKKALGARVQALYAIVKAQSNRNEVVRDEDMNKLAHALCQRAGVYPIDMFTEDQREALFAKIKKGFSIKLSHDFPAGGALEKAEKDQLRRDEEKWAMEVNAQLLRGTDDTSFHASLKRMGSITSEEVLARHLDWEKRLGKIAPQHHPIDKLNSQPLDWQMKYIETLAMKIMQTDNIEIEKRRVTMRLKTKEEVEDRVQDFQRKLDQYSQELLALQRELGVLRSPVSSDSSDESSSPETESSAKSSSPETGSSTNPSSPETGSSTNPSSPETGSSSTIDVRFSATPGSASSKASRTPGSASDTPDSADKPIEDPRGKGFTPDTPDKDVKYGLTDEDLTRRQFFTKIDEQMKQFYPPDHVQSLEDSKERASIYMDILDDPEYLEFEGQNLTHKINTRMAKYLYLDLPDRKKQAALGGRMNDIATRLKGQNRARFAQIFKFNTFEKGAPSKHASPQAIKNADFAKERLHLWYTLFYRFKQEKAEARVRKNKEK